MFDFDVGKLLLIGVVALIFIPPKDLPEALRMVGRLVGQARRMAAEFQSQFHEAMREAELTEIRDGLNDLKQKTSMEGALSRVADMLEAPAAPKAEALGRHAGRDRRRRSPRGPIIVEDQPPPPVPPRATVAPSTEPSRRANPRRKARMTQADIDATKAPLIEHLIELRARLIKALVAFLDRLRRLFLFLAPYLQYPARALCPGGRRRKRQADRHPFPGAIPHPAEIVDVRRRLHRLPDHRAANLQIRRAGPLSATSGRPSRLISSRRRRCSSSARCWSISRSCPFSSAFR